tara:strand:- start:5 stop:337 length:333 start_codon:yes stop_codon:yes gene_type:complete
MTIIRNSAELRFHNRMTDAVWRDNAQAAAIARDEHARLLEQWRKWEREQPEACEAFNAMFGEPPWRETEEGWEAARLRKSSCECPYLEGRSREDWLFGFKTYNDIARRSF